MLKCTHICTNEHTQLICNANNMRGRKKENVKKELELEKENKKQYSGFYRNTLT